MAQWTDAPNVSWLIINEGDPQSTGWIANKHTKRSRIYTAGDLKVTSWKYWPNYVYFILGRDKAREDATGMEVSNNDSVDNKSWLAKLKFLPYKSHLMWNIVLVAAQIVGFHGYLIAELGIWVIRALTISLLPVIKRLWPIRQAPHSEPHENTM